MSIIYKIEDCIHILSASSEALEKMTIEEIAAQAIPESVKYFIVDSTTFPSEPTESWELSEDGVITVNQDKVAELKIASYPTLTNRQFHLTLVMNELEDTVRSAINAIEDPKRKAIVNIEFNKADRFKRTGTSILFMQEQLGMSNDELNKLWEQALAIPD